MQTSHMTGPHRNKTPLREVFRLACLAALFALAPVGAWALEENQEPSDLPADYSHALALTVTGKQGVVSFRLPQAVYLHSRSAELADLRLFDANGAKLPFALYVPSPQIRMRQQSWPVKRFPVTSSQSQPQTVDGLSLDIKTSADGALLSVKTKPGKRAQGGEQQALVGLVLDVGKPGPLIGALRFAPPASRPAYSAQIWLEVSDDLQHWDTAGAAELSWLVNGQETLANDRLEFAPRRFHYARLHWRDGEALEFAEITAEAVEQTADAPSLEKLALPPAPGRKPNDWLYRAGPAIPVEKIELRFSEPNVVLPADIGTYRERPAQLPGQPSTWVFQPLGRHVFYQISQAGSLRRSGDWPVPVSHYAEWVVRPQTASASRPEIVLFWQPATLVFLAAGQAPYTLAFGREGAKPAAAELAQVAPGFSAQELAHIEPAEAGPLQTRPASATGTASAAQAAAAAAQHRSLILWGVLLAGVAVLGTMVWRLLRQMR